MTKAELSKLTDQELLELAKKMKSSAFMSAFVIGIMIGVIIFSIVKSTIGLFTLIPLFFILKIVNADKKNQALKEVLAERNLK